MVANKNENLNDLFYFKSVTEESIPKKSATQSTEKLLQKQPPRGVPRKRCSEKMPQIYRRTPCRSVISIKLQSNFIEITLRHRCFPVNLLHIFRTPFLKNTSVRLLHENNYRPVNILPNISKIHESLFI